MGERPVGRDADVIVVGAGGGGLMAALAPARGGAKVLLLERNAVVGGTFLIAGGSFAAANTRLTKEAGTNDNPSLYYEDILRIGRHGANPELTRKFVESAGPTLDWLLDHGLELNSAKPRFAVEHELYRIARTYGAKGGAKGFIATLKPLVEEERRKGNIDLRLRTKVTALLRQDDGPVVGVRAEGESAGELHAPFVILASGGYGANHEMIKKYSPEFEAVLSSCPRHCDGAMHEAAAAVGAALVHMTSIRPYPWFLAHSDNPRRVMAPWGYMLRAMGPINPGSIWVNAEGRRVINEDCRSMNEIEDALVTAPDKTIHVVFDMKTRRSVEVCPIGAWDWAKFDEVGRSGVNKQIVIADTPEELAHKAGGNPGNLAATIAKYNEYVRAGHDPEFGRQPKIALDAPPYYLVITHGSVMAMLGGVKVNDSSQVLDTADRVIPGLYAIGEAAGFAQYGGEAYVSGVGNGSALIFGKLVGEAVARLLKEPVGA